MLGMKAQISSKVVFFLAQSLVGKFLYRSTILTNHETMAALCSTQAALHKSAAGQHLVSKIEATE